MKFFEVEIGTAKDPEAVITVRVTADTGQSMGLTCVRACGADIGEGLLDRIEVGAVGWQVEQSGLPAFDGLLNAGDLVAGQIVHDDNMGDGNQS